MASTKCNCYIICDNTGIADLCVMVNTRWSTRKSKTPFSFRSHRTSHSQTIKNISALCAKAGAPVRGKRCVFDVATLRAGKQCATRKQPVPPVPAPVPPPDSTPSPPAFPTLLMASWSLESLGEWRPMSPVRSRSVSPVRSHPASPVRSRSVSPVGLCLGVSGWVFE